MKRNANAEYQKRFKENMKRDGYEMLTVYIPQEQKKYGKEEAKILEETRQEFWSYIVKIGLKSYMKEKEKND